MQPAMPISPKLTLGLWPLSGVTTIGVSDRDREDTMQTAIQCGIESFDTAYSYGLGGEADRLVRQFLAPRRDQYRIHGKIGQRYEDGVRVVRCDHDTLLGDAEQSLRRCGIDRFDTLLLHGVDSNVAVEQSAATMRSILERGLAEKVGICNATIEQMQTFADHCPLSATQCGLNLLQHDALEHFIPWCVRRGVRVDVFWTLMKGLLAGKIRRGHSFAPGDSRSGYAIFQGEAFEDALRSVDRLEKIAAEQQTNIAALSVGWAMSQPGVDGVLVGARKPEQIDQIARAAVLSDDLLSQLES